MVASKGARCSRGRVGRASAAHITTLPANTPDTGVATTLLKPLWQKSTAAPLFLIECSPSANYLHATPLHFRAAFMRDIPEADWKYMGRLKSALLERLCERINQKTVAILNDPALTAYERYLDIFQQTNEDNGNVASAFDDWRRSTIFIRIMDIYRQGLFTDEELQGFTQDTQERIDVCKPVKKE
jgi:hypothetical protein